MTSTTTASRSVRRWSAARCAWAVALIAQAGLAAGLVAWAGWIAGVILSLPLLLPLPGLLRGRPRSAAWGCYVMIVYIAGLLSEAYTMPERHLVGLILSSVALLAFLSLILFVRWSAREREASRSGAVAAGQKESSDGARR